MATNSEQSRSHPGEEFRDGAFWSLPYSSRREAILGRRVVATSQPLAAQAGLAMMQRGGNAIDAAVAAAITLTVVEPTSNGIGSDAFAIVHDGESLHGLNASGRSPRRLDIDRFRGRSEMPSLGWDAVTVPGCVGAWRALSDRFGWLPFADLFEAAIEHAANGYPLSRQTAGAWSRSAERFREFEQWRATFLVDGEPPRAGQTVRLPDHARTLRRIAVSGGDDFYHGDLAGLIADAAHRDGATFSAEDLAEHAAEWVEPIAIDYRGVRVHEMPPNGQGIAALIGLGALAHHDIGSRAVDDVETLHLQIEAMKLGLADAHRHVADPDHLRIDPAELLDSRRLQSLGASIDPQRAGAPGVEEPRYGGTVLVVAADDDGRAISLIQSNYQGFGSGIVIPGTGIALQNRGAGFTLRPDHPNAIGPGKRPFHTIIPGMLTRGGNPLMAFGVMGGPMQAQGHLQLVSRLVDFGQNPQAGLDGPRWQVEGDHRVLVEPGFPAEALEALRRRGHEIDVAGDRTVRFGGGQAIYALDDGWFGASDLRRDGQAVAC